MREADAQAVALVRAFEEVDEEGRLLPADERVRATAEARERAGDDEASLLRVRAEILLRRLADFLPVERVLSVSRVGAGLGPVVLLGALVLGFASNALGPDRKIHVLFGPMLGLVAWNLLVYAFFLVRLPRLRIAKGGAGAAMGSAVRGVGGFVGMAARWLVDRTCSRARARHAADQALVARAVARYANAWRAAGAALLGSRLRRLLHLGAIAFVVGTTIGMYVRGLGLRYEAVWESTFLSREQADGLVRVLLRPAAAVLGESMERVRVPEQGKPEPANLWIHLWAMTGVLFVVLPRTALVLRENLRLRRLVADVPLDLRDAYYRRLLATGGGARRSADVAPWGMRPDARGRDALTALLHDVLGTRAEIRWVEPLPYGAEAEDVARGGDGGEEGGNDAGGGGGVLVLLLPLAQPPEIEVHGRLVQELRARETPLVVVVDASGYRERLGEESPRLAERRRAWDRVLADAGASAVHVDLGRPVPDTVVSALAAPLSDRA